MQIEPQPLDHQTGNPDQPPLSASQALIEGARLGVVIAFAALALGLPALHLAQGHRLAAIAESTGRLAPKPPRHADFAAEPASKDARFIANWVTDSSDNRDLSFVIIDKKNAKVFVFDPSGKLLGAAPVLLGGAKGDDSVPGIGQRPLAQVLPEERTTPAGRFVGEPGRNAAGEDIVWVDYDAAVSMHRVRTGNPREQRLERLASPTTDDNRISFGCINLPAAFYDKVLSPVFRARYGVVYVLPDVKPLREVFAAAYEPRDKQRAALAGRPANSPRGATPRL